MRVIFTSANWRGEERPNDLDVPAFFKRAIAECCYEAPNDLADLQQKHEGLLNYVSKLTETLLEKGIVTSDEVINALGIGPKAWSQPFRDIRFTKEQL